MPTTFDLPDVNSLLVKNEALFNHVHIVNQTFDILPDGVHYGMAIDYVDLQESREQFVRELINTVIDWVYSRARQNTILRELEIEGRTIANAFAEMNQKAFEKFRSIKDGSLLQGQFGELLLANCLQHVFGAVPVLRKMPITTSFAHERFGSDAIHYKYIDDTPTFFIGEAKSYTSKYGFNAAFEAALTSILNEHANIRTEIRQYLHEDFLDEGLQQLATDLINGKLKNAQFRLVSIVAYEETGKRNGKTRDEILSSITKIITGKYAGFDNSKIDLIKNPILNRITYIVFPIWDFANLLENFSTSMPTCKVGG